MPSRATTPGLKFSTTTSDCSARASTISRPRSCFRSTTTLRFDRLAAMRYGLTGTSPWTHDRTWSPSGGSSLMTSAPASASIMVAYGPLMACDRSSTRMPASGGIMSGARGHCVWLLQPDVEEVRRILAEPALDRRTQLRRGRDALAWYAHRVCHGHEI